MSFRDRHVDVIFFLVMAAALVGIVVNLLSRKDRTKWQHRPTNEQVPDKERIKDEVWEQIIAPLRKKRDDE